jgi:hypothetical protein
MGFPEVSNSQTREQGLVRCPLGTGTAKEDEELIDCGHGGLLATAAPPRRELLQVVLLSGPSRQARGSLVVILSAIGFPAFVDEESHDGQSRDRIGPPQPEEGIQCEAPENHSG